MTNHERKAEQGELWTNVDKNGKHKKSIWLKETETFPDDIYGGPSRYGPDRDYVANCRSVELADGITVEHNALRGIPDPKAYVEAFEKMKSVIENDIETCGVCGLGGKCAHDPRCGVLKVLALATTATGSEAEEKERNSDA